ncbi:DUF4238 domain-containing protein [Fertoebacter nigrum]|uniref:DUF4238 domain-containing protein n=1 Tax=Fertoeibacter niger TaxID=2656921 RepID=A0A8X8H681_9RHOB|nr:DUF4238 domain-containing protein [Fertoeibacter niger]NUB43861.1 DUF4238 domain-containing protein [Fertoeibacter niger]
MATKANHHYIPQFYLRGFSAGIGRQAQVFVFDSDTKKSFTTLVRNIGSRRHFNRVEAHGVGPNHIEDAMSKIEAEIAPHLQQVIEAQAFPGPEHFNSIMNLMALLSVRNPRLRGNMSDFHKDVVERIMGLSVSTNDIWESQIRKMRESGVPVKEDVTYDEMKRFHEERNYEIVIDQTHLITLELKMVEPVLEQLSRRSWCFARAPKGHQFITCDDPTVLSWTDKVKQPNPWSPGHGLQNTIVMFTLSPELALVGLFEDLPQRSDYRPEQVVALNTAVARHSRNQIYARDGGFMLHLKDGQFVRSDELTRVFLGRG